MPDYKLTYQSTLEAEKAFLDDVRILLPSVEESQEDFRGFLLALSEAFTNAVIHGSGRDSNRTIKISLTINERRFGADIVDEGRGGLDKVLKKRPAGPMAEGGRGVDLMRHFATSVEFAETASGGLKVSIGFDRIRKNEVNKCT